MNNKLLLISGSLIFSFAIANASKNQSLDEGHNSHKLNSKLLIDQSSETDQLKNYLSQARYFNISESQLCRDGSKPVVVNFYIAEYDPNIVDISATASVPGQTTDYKNLYNGKYKLLNKSYANQNMNTPEFQQEYYMAKSTSTTKGWNIGGTTKLSFFYIYEIGVQAGYNNSNSSSVESSERQIFKVSTSPVLVPAQSYAIVNTRYAQTSLNGTYNFTQKMSGTMRPMYHLVCNDGTKISDFTPPKTHYINYFLRKNYNLRYLPTGITPDVNLYSPYFTAKGNGVYSIQQGAEFTATAYGCKPTDTISPCNPDYFYHPDDGAIIYDGNSTYTAGEKSTSQIIPKPDLRSPFK
ncbi:MAG: ETX/MTX2 family pore-forming toxin [Neisseriaceae bacterium]